MRELVLDRRRLARTRSRVYEGAARFFGGPSAL